MMPVVDEDAAAHAREQSRQYFEQRGWLTLLLLLGVVTALVRRPMQVQVGPYLVGARIRPALGWEWGVQRIPVPVPAPADCGNTTDGLVVVRKGTALVISTPAGKIGIGGFEGHRQAAPAPPH
jgi:hypothetical protein